MDKHKEFMNIWEIESHFKCPVVGAMLTVDKHRSILKKCGWDVSRLKPYEYHSTLMGCLGDENAVSVKVNNTIRHQAREFMAAVAQTHAEEGDIRLKIRNLWKSWAARGNIGPAMYALVSHEKADLELLRDIHGEVHMLSHANMTEVFDIRKKINAANENLGREKKRVAEKTGRIRELVSAAKAQARALTRLEEENTRLKRQLASMQDNAAADNDRAPGDKRRIARLEAELAEERSRAAEAERRENKARADLFSVRNENHLMRGELQNLLASFSMGQGAGICPAMADSGGQASARENCPKRGDCGDRSCPNYTLCARRVFMIGGITKMKAHYRELVEKAGGQFDYHDGYMKNASENLAAKVRRCDVVVCPVSCNSHSACLKVKKLCQRYNKELKILNSASLSSVSQALFVQETAQMN